MRAHYELTLLCAVPVVAFGVILIVSGLKGLLT
jgi:hypothetical protein